MSLTRTQCAVLVLLAMAGGVPAPGRRLLPGVVGQQPEGGRDAACPTVAALTAQVRPNGEGHWVQVRGCCAENDGGGGGFRWKAGSRDAPDGGTVLASSVDENGRWERAGVEDSVSVLWFGARRDDPAFDSTPAFTAAADASYVPGA